MRQRELRQRRQGVRDRHTDPQTENTWRGGERLAITNRADPSRYIDLCFKAVLLRQGGDTALLMRRRFAPARTKRAAEIFARVAGPKRRKCGEIDRVIHRRYSCLGVTDAIW
jgi:hypothetical protein